MKEFLLIRTSETDKVVYGILAVRNGNIIEGVWKTIENKVKLFPIGVYPIRLEYSPRFNRDLWELHDIEGRAEIKIHVANYYYQLIGCIGVGMSHQDINADGTIDLSQSRIALDEVHAEMEGLQETMIAVVQAYR